MALTFQDYTANGTAVSFAIPFDRIRDVHVRVFYGATEITTGWSVAGNNVVFTSPPANGTVIRVRRITDFSERLVDYVDGSRLNEVDLDTDSKQAFYLIQESRDINDDSLVKNSLGNWDANFARIQSVANPVDNNDATNKQYLDNIANNFASYGVGSPTTRWAFTGNGSSLIYPITGATLTASTYYLVTLNGVVQDPNSYTVSTNTLTFNAAPANGSAGVVVLLGYPKIASTDAIATSSIQNGAVTADKLASTLNLSTKTVTLPNTSVTAGQLASTLNLSTKTLTLPTSVVEPTNCATDLFYNIAPVGAVINSVQVVDSTYKSTPTTTNLIPADGTIPQITEGTLAYSATITPKFATSKIRITVSGHVGTSTAMLISLALFKGSGVNAIGSGVTYCDIATSTYPVTFSVDDVAGGTAPITYSVRFGPNTAATARLNGTNTSVIHTTLGSFIRLEEIKQ